MADLIKITKEAKPRIPDRFHFASANVRCKLKKPANGEKCVRVFRAIHKYHKVSENHNSFPCKSFCKYVE